MSFLAPLYALGVLAISLPVIFHLIRRTPRGRTIFSSLMFLTPSPPRITRRSRLEHLLLLLLRAAALVLLALAFARPFFRQTAQLGLFNSQTRKVAILIDTSASMRRGNIWQQSLSQAQALLDDLNAADDVALFAFDDRLHRIVDFDAQASTDAQARRAAVRRELNQLQPGWGSSNLGEALSALADQMDADADRNQSDAALQIQLFSDLQEGTRLDALQSHQWPASVHVEAHVLGEEDGNAGLQEMVDLDDSRAGTWRVRVSNDELSTHDQFNLQWLGTNAQPLPQLAARSVYVPAGQHRVVRLTPPEGLVDNISGVRLLDDPFDFDNTLYLATIKPRPVHVVYAGSDAADDLRGMRYYFQQAIESDPRRTIKYSVIGPGELSAAALTDAQLLVLAAAPSAATMDAIQQFASAGGWVIASIPNAEQFAALGSLLDVDELQVREAEMPSYAMLSEIDFDHPLFARLAEARYSDFTKIRFWKMRQLDLPAHDDVRVLASFDNQLPALIQRVIGDGCLLVLTSTWSPDDSQLALSTKFVPLVAGWLNAASPLPEQPTRQFTGQSFQSTAIFDPAKPITLRTPSGQVHEISASDAAEQRFDEPGHYQSQQGDIQQTIAVNVPASESRTSSLDPSVLEQFGVLLGKVAAPETSADRQRQLRDQELEKRQQLWRWLIAAALAALLFETWIAGYTTRRVAMQQLNFES